jgi:hypothetical protein
LIVAALLSPSLPVDHYSNKCDGGADPRTPLIEPESRFIFFFPPHPFHRKISKKEPAKNYAVFRQSLSMRFPKYKEDLKVALVTRAQHLGSCGYDARNSDNGHANRSGLAGNLLCRCRDATRAPKPTQTLTYNFCGALPAAADEIE